VRSVKTACCVLAFLVVAAMAHGRTLTNEKAGITLEVPDGWVESAEMAKAVPPSAELIAGLAATAGGRTFTALSASLKPNEAVGYTKGLLSSLTNQGFSLSANTPVTINGVNFDSYTGTRADATIPTLQIFSAFGNDHAYAISLYSQIGDPTHDAELQGLVQSFRFQVPPKPFPTNTAYNIGYQAGRTLGAWAGGTLAIAGMLACPAALIVAAYFLFRKKK